MKNAHCSASVAPRVLPFSGIVGLAPTYRQHLMDWKYVRALQSRRQKRTSQDCRIPWLMTLKFFSAGPSPKIALHSGRAWLPTLSAAYGSKIKQGVTTWRAKRVGFCAPF